MSVWAASHASGAGPAKDGSAWSLAGLCGLAGWRGVTFWARQTRDSCAQAGHWCASLDTAFDGSGRWSPRLAPRGLAAGEDGQIRSDLGWAGSGVGEGISGREKDEREEGEKERKRKRRERRKVLGLFGFSKPDFILLSVFQKRNFVFACFLSCLRFLTNTTLT